MKTRDEWTAAGAGMTVDDLAERVDAATTEDELYVAVTFALQQPGWQQMTRLPADRPLLLRVRQARSRLGLVTSEEERKAHNRDAEQRLMNERARKRAS